MTINLIAIHCSDSPHGRGDNAETIHKWHLEKGWSGIGYHYVIDEFGNLERGRPHYWTGAHVKNHNRNSLGICLIGKNEFTPEQFNMLAELLRELTSKYPNAKIKGHYQLDTQGKTCPNFDVPEYLRSRGFGERI